MQIITIIFSQKETVLKKRTLLLALGISSTLLQSAEQPLPPHLDSKWFYDTNNLYNKPNREHQGCNWKVAANVYKQLLHAGVGDDTDKAKALINLAACKWAQGKSSTGWNGIDLLLIPKEQQVSQEIINNATKEKKEPILVITANAGIGDIAHFFKAAHELEQLGFNVTMSVPDYLKETFSANVYGLKIMGAKEAQPEATYVTHLVSLLGHLNMHPASVIPEKPLFIAQERAINAVEEQINPILAQDHEIAIVLLGENRQATLFGGKQLDRRHLDSKPFMQLLENHPKLTLLDCGTKASLITVDEDKKDRCAQLTPEQKPFDTLIALAFVMSMNKKIIAFGADNGPTNVFARALNKDGQRRMAFIIPGECDMRTEGSGAVYKQSISHCPIYRCQTPADQTQVIENAYNNMTNGNDEDMIFRVINPGDLAYIESTPTTTPKIITKNAKRFIYISTSTTNKFVGINVYNEQK